VCVCASFSVQTGHLHWANRPHLQYNHTLCGVCVCLCASCSDGISHFHWANRPHLQYSQTHVPFHSSNVYYFLFTPYNLLLTIYSLQFTPYYLLLSITHELTYPFTVQMFTTSYLLLTIYSLLFTPFQYSRTHVPCYSSNEHHAYLCTRSSLLPDISYLGLF
jgi:hypothetical protein